VFQTESCEELGMKLKMWLNLWTILWKKKLTVQSLKLKVLAEPLVEFVDEEIDY
jgi:hypothetical protein